MFSYRAFGEDVEDERENGEVDSDSSATKSLTQVFWHCISLSRPRTKECTVFIGHTSCPFKEQMMLWGHPFMTFTKNLDFLLRLPLSTCVHMRRIPSPLWTFTCMKYTSLS